MVPQSILVGASFQHSFKCNYVINSFKSHSHVGDDKPRWRCPSDATLLIKCCWNSLNHGLSLNNIPPGWSEHARSFVYTQKVFSLSLTDAKHNFDGLWRRIIWFFLCPQMVWILLVFLIRIHCIAPRWSTFQGVSRKVDVISTRDFANSINVLESNLIFQRSCLFKSNCWNEIKEMLVLEKIFWKSSFLVKDPTHVIQNMQSFDCLVFWKQKLTRCKIKMTFFMVFCVSFNLWSWVYLLMVCDEVTFCELQETKGSSQNSRISQEMVAFLFWHQFYQHA
jgi:hypothetical protein